MKSKAFFITFKGLSVVINHHRLKSVPLSNVLNFPEQLFPKELSSDASDEYNFLKPWFCVKVKIIV